MGDQKKEEEEEKKKAINNLTQRIEQIAGPNFAKQKFFIEFLLDQLPEDYEKFKESVFYIDDMD